MCRQGGSVPRHPCWSEASENLARSQDSTLASANPRTLQDQVTFIVDFLLWYHKGAHASPKENPSLLSKSRWACCSLKDLHFADIMLSWQWASFTSWNQNVAAGLANWFGRHERTSKTSARSISDSRVFRLRWQTENDSSENLPTDLSFEDSSSSVPVLVCKCVLQASQNDKEFLSEEGCG